MNEQADEFEGWAILELMGHRKLAGYVRPATIAGAGVIRIDVPKADGEGDIATQFYAPSALYCLTPVAENIARAMAANYQPQPVSRWELPPEIEAAYEAADDERRLRREQESEDTWRPDPANPPEY